MKNKVDISLKESPVLVTHIDTDIAEEMAINVLEISEQAAAETIAVLFETFLLYWSLDFPGKD